MQPKYRIAAKHVNVMDRVEPARLAPVPVSIVRVVRPTVPQHRVHSFVRELKAWFANESMSEFDDRTLADLVGTGLLGQ